MSYKDKPQIKLYKYETNSFVLQAIIDDYQECSFEHNLYEAGTFTITINYNIPNALLFERGLFVQFGSNPYDFGEIITIQDSIGEDGKGSQIRTITGFDSRYILKRRVIKNMNSNGLWVMTDKGEIVLRSLIQDQCGSNAEAKRQLPINNTIPSSSSAIGKEYSVSENFSNLYEVCKTIATQSEIGWRLSFDGSGLTLEVYAGTDRSQTVRFDTSYESLSNGEFKDSSDSFSNAIYIGGKGQNDDRDIYEGEDGTPSGLDRFESWDNQSSMTTESEYEAEAISMLTQYGQTLTMRGNGLAKCPYIFREQYDIGDFITVAFSGKSAKAQILSITEHWVFAAYDLEFSFGKPQPTQSDQLQLMLRKIQEASNKTNSTDSVRWYTIPTDTAMPKADVTYNTIGFVGNCASGGSTFQLYLDNEKTGAKTYHVYFKQLGGGNLTLTTGVSGATDLVLNSGTYVAIIYVDENGNVTNTASTPTETIEAGNTQPATSSGVSSAIETTVQQIQALESSLPADAVLHYSFDEVPDYPDGSAVYYKNRNFTAINDWSYNSVRTTLSLDNGSLKAQSTGAVAYVQIWGTQTSATNISDKIIKIKYHSNASATFVTQDNGGSYTIHPMQQKNLGNNQYLVVDLVPTVSYGQLLSFYFNTTSANNYIIIDEIYIGDGSYSSPIIDNANGQNNSVSAQCFVADKGVSGKGITFYNGDKKTIRVKWNSSNWDRAYTISCWIKVNNSNVYIVGWDTNYTVQNHFLRYNNTNKNIWFDVNENTRFIGYICNVDLDDGKWHNIVAINKFESGKAEIWIDGEKKTLTTQTRSVAGTEDYFLIGTSKGQTNYYDASNSQIDDYQIFDRALSNTEVQALYLNKANTPKYYPPVVSEWNTLDGNNINNIVRYNEIAISVWFTWGGREILLSKTFAKGMLSASGNQTVDIGGYYYSASDYGLCNLNNNAGVITLRNVIYAGSNVMSSASIKIRYR